MNFKANSSCSEIFYKPLKNQEFQQQQKFRKFSRNFVRISQNGLSKMFAKKQLNFRRKVEIFVEFYRKCFQSHFRTVYRNFAKEIERKFGNPTVLR